MKQSKAKRTKGIGIRMGVSNNITAVLNFIAMLASIPIIASGIWLASKPDNECIAKVYWPIVIIGILIVLVSLAGFVDAYWNKQGLLALYLFFIALCIVPHHAADNDDTSTAGACRFSLSLLTQPS